MDHGPWTCLRPDGLGSVETSNQWPAAVRLLFQQRRLGVAFGNIHAAEGHDASNLPSVCISVYPW